MTSDPFTLRATRAVPALLWAAAIYLSSEIPGSGIPSIPGAAIVAHFVEYAVLSALIAFALGANVPTIARVLIPTLIATVFGIVDEFHQSFTPGRTPDVLDVVVDFLGALLGAWLMTRVIASIRARNLDRR